MMFAFSRDGAVPGHQLWRKVAPNRVPRNAVWAIVRPLRAADGAGDLELPRRLRRRHGDRGDRPLHRVRDPGVPALPDARPVRARRLEPRQATTSGSTCSRSPGSRSSRSCSSSRSTRRGSRGSPTSRWELTNYTVLWFAAIGIVFGGWWFVSAQELVQGPRASGHRGGTGAHRGRVSRQGLAATGACCLAAVSYCGRSEGRRRRRPSSFTSPAPARAARCGPT